MPEHIRILIVDDNTTNLKVLSAALSEADYKVLAAVDGERALNIARTAQPALILLDINMPGMDGYEVCRLLKADTRTAHIPVIFISAQEDTMSKIQGFEAGGVDYITKPFQKEEVFARVDTHLRIYQLTQDLEERNQRLEVNNYRMQQTLDELERVKAQLEESNREMWDSIQYAQRLQDALMPQPESLCTYFPDSFILYLPRDVVSGDFYWFHQRREKIFVVAADCTGHGVPGAFMSVIGLQMLHSFVVERGITDPASILEELDYEIEQRLNQRGEGVLSKDGMDLAIARFDLRLNQMKYASAMRHLYLISDGELHDLKGERYPVGGGQYENNIFSNHKHELQAGDVVYLFSDGYTDQFGGDEKAPRKYTPKRFKQLLLEMHQAPMPQQKTRLLQEFQDWSHGQPQLDDILVMGLRYQPSAFRLENPEI